MPKHAAIADVIDALREEGGIAHVGVVAERLDRSPRSIRAIARSARLWEPFPTVIGLPRPRPSSSDLALAATIRYAGRTGEPSRDLIAVTRRSALALLGVQPVAPSRVELVVPASRCPRVDKRCAMLRSDHLAVSEVVRSARIPVVTGAALLRDLAGVRTVERLRTDAIELIRIGYVDLLAIETMVRRCERFAGRGRLRQVLAELSDVGRVDSPFELAARRRFEAAGITLDPGQVCVPRPPDFAGTWRMHLDLGIAAIRFGIELDSFRYHSTPEALRRDAERANRLALLPDDWRVVHVTWADLEDGWQQTRSMVERVIAAQTGRHGRSNAALGRAGAIGASVRSGRCGCQA